MLDPFVDAVVGFQFLGRDAVRSVPAAFKPKTALRKQCAEVGAMFSFSTELHFIVAIRLPSFHRDKSVGSQERKDRQKKRTQRLAKFAGRNLLASQRGPFVIWKLISRNCSSLRSGVGGGTTGLGRTVALSFRSRIANRIKIP